MSVPVECPGVLLQPGRRNALWRWRGYNAVEKTHRCPGCGNRIVAKTGMHLWYSLCEDDCCSVSCYTVALLRWT